MSNDATLPSGDDLATPLGTDFYLLDELLTEEERAFRDGVRATCHERIAPIAGEYWNAGGIDDRMVKTYFDLGVAGIGLEESGKGFSPLAEGMISLELARADGALATFNAVHSALVMTSMSLLGDAEQKERWLPKLASGEILGAMGLTEPTHGSDVVQLETTAVRDGDFYILNGAKRWIGLATVCDIVIVWARDDDGKWGRRSPTVA
ncbi:dimethylallyladenosine tRNA methylthiotransferase [Platysternon megacephalum]|uniref:Dimethylallyladenosine tRNA methylthiotransferase n=1 Tax=Platysternon megacephalum TaxID=55544 RepID=A0A4D9DGX3_9SAUR|nr:dimethylallyladenosine tRNA methylthiotransferase [Platysternon megacephalum]